MTPCTRCNGNMYLSVRNGDDAIDCPACGGTGEQRSLTSNQEYELLKLWHTIAPTETHRRECDIAEVLMWNELNAYTPMTQEEYEIDWVDRNWDRLGAYWDWQREQIEYHDMQRGY